MSHETIIYGMIDAGDLTEEEGSNRHHELNRAVLASLPERDQEPVLTRDMFAVTGKQSTFRSQVIHFAASMQSLEHQWHLWLAKFETLLRRLHWFGVILHMESELLEGDYQYHWLIEDDELDRCFFSDGFKPVEHWEFSGGPRKFDL